MASSKEPLLPREAAKKQKNGGVIQYHLLLRLAFKNLVFKKLRTSLTIIGVIIGIGAIVFLFSFGLGLQDLVSRQVVSSDSVQTIDVSTARSKVLQLDQETADEISGITNVENVGSSYSTAGKISRDSSTTETVIFSTDKTFLDLSSLQFIEGKTLGVTDTDKVLINKSLVEALGFKDPKSAVNQPITVSFTVKNSDDTKRTADEKLTISGVYDSESRAEIFISNDVTKNENISDITQLKVVADDKDAVPDIRQTIESLGYSTTSPLDTISQIDQVFSLLRLVLVGFGGIGMIIAILGMFNTLTISLLERTREISLMISLGARKQDVRRMFITEAMLLSLIGGIVGVLGAVTLGFLGNVILTSYARNNNVDGNIQAFLFSPQLIIGTIVLSALVGLAVVYFPARRAAQINPIDAVKKE